MLGGGAVHVSEVPVDPSFDLSTFFTMTFAVTVGYVLYALCTGLLVRGYANRSPGACGVHRWLGV